MCFAQLQRSSRRLPQISPQHPAVAAAAVVQTHLVSRPTAVKQRIRAIKNIGKITKAMKMVAASKMRNAQTAVEHSRGIVEPFVRLFGDYPGVGWQSGCFFWGGIHTETQWPTHTQVIGVVNGSKANASHLCVCAEICAWKGGVPALWVVGYHPGVVVHAAVGRVQPGRGRGGLL